MKQATNSLEGSLPARSPTTTTTTASESKTKPTKAPVPKTFKSVRIKTNTPLQFSSFQDRFTFSKLYSLLYHKQEEQQTQTLPDSVLKKFCLKCGNLFIPGLTVSVRVVYTKQKIRKLRTRCLACRHSVFDDGLIQKQEK